MKNNIAKRTKQFYLITFLIFVFGLKTQAEPYTLTSDDVVVVNGVITSCSYDFSNSDIIIPSTLDDQTVIAILNGTTSTDGVFYDKGITSVVLPSTINDIGNKAFYNNNIDSLDISNCTALERIGHRAFKANSIDTVILSSDAPLVCIGDEAFYSNEISSISLEDYTSLITIGNSAFAENTISSFNLPVINNADFQYWIDGSGNKYDRGASIAHLNTYYYTNIFYTLTDDDVVVEDGIITSCSYDFRCTNIVIPTILDTQSVTGIANGTSSSNAVFSSKGITGVQLPSTMETIGSYTFYNNQKLDSLNIDVCTNLSDIGDYAFYNNTIGELDLSGCITLSYIGDWAFYSNNLSTIDFSSNTTLIYIGYKAFYNNNITSFFLPTVSDDSFEYWFDSDNNHYAENESASNFQVFYKAYLPYTLTSDDVDVVDGVVISCSYDFSKTDIIIPSVLDSQTVTAILNGTSSIDAVFYNKSITSVVLPSTIKDIGDMAFFRNNIVSIDFSNCTALERIGHYAFISNDINAVVLSADAPLVSIGDKAFYNNKISSVDIVDCTSLITIGNYAFAGNSISSFNLPVNTNTDFQYWIDGNDNKYDGGISITNLSTYYYTNMFYTLTDDDVVVEDGIITSCDYDFRCTNIIIPDILDGQSITGIEDASSSSSAVFAYKGITGVQLPSTMETIGNYAFCNNILDSLNVDACLNLTNIGSYAFYNNNIDVIDLSNCTNLSYIGDWAFYGNNLSSVDFSSSSTLVYIGKNAFNNNNITSFVLPAVANSTFEYWYDSDNNHYAENETVNDFTVLYKAYIPYTLTDDDVVVVDGVITSCSYDFSKTDIIIPTTLDGQTITSIASASTTANGVFFNKGIISLVLLSTIKEVGDNAFYGNEIVYVDLSNCANLSYIGDWAFYGNNLSCVDFSSSSTLVYIGKNAFNDNNITSFVLPAVADSAFEYWYDSDNNHYAENETINDFTVLYKAYIPYTLTDDDVVVEDGVITSCSYDFSNTDIIIPSVLDSQTVIAILNGTTSTDGIFYYKGITSLVLPSTIKDVGNKAFYSNNIINLDLRNCTALERIGHRAFKSNIINTFNLSSNAPLICIGDEAFYNNEIDSVNLDYYTSLITIGKSAFFENNIDSLYLPVNKNTEFKYWIDGNGDEYDGGVSVTDLNTYYYTNIFYVLTDDDLVVEDGVITSCSYDFRCTNIIIPDSLNDQSLKGIIDASSSSSAVFSSKGITAVKLPSTMETIGSFAFFNNNKLDSLNVDDCGELSSIGASAFYNNKIGTLNLSNCSYLTRIGEMAFYNDSLTYIDLSYCTYLTYIGAGAFDCAKLDSFVLPEPSIDGYTFNYWEDGEGNHYTADETVFYLGTSYIANLSEINSSVIGANVNNSLGLEVYPNPVNDFICIKNAQGLSFAIIYNLTGKVVFAYRNFNLLDSEIVINTTELNSGVYILKCVVDGQCYTNRLLKK